jgi:hypothetical protein
MTAKQELISITLEVIAFFFVTTELYGKENLEGLSKHTSSMADAVQARIAKYIGEKLSSDTAPFEKLLGKRTYFDLFGGVRGFKRGVFFIYLPLFILPYVGGCIYAVITGFPDNVTAIVLLICSAVPVGFATFLLLVYLVSDLASIAERLLKIVGFKGVLLGVGAVLFLLAKGLPWVSALRQLIAGHD